jgi:phosphoribosylformylglycinamidine (FGAM) synthase PurS component
VDVELVRGNSKSDEVKVETATFSLRTDVIEITQEFLCNSTLERYEFARSIRSEDIKREL